MVPSHNQARTLHCTSYALTHVVEIQNTLEHNTKVKLDPEEQWGHQLRPPVDLQPPALENMGDSLQHALKCYLALGLHNINNPEVGVTNFTATGYVWLPKTVEDFKKWLASGYPIFTGQWAHAFAVVGYDENKKTFMCKNSLAADPFTIDYSDVTKLFTPYIFYDKQDLTMIYKDVSTKSPMAKNIQRMLDLGLMKGYGADTIADPKERFFMPNQPVTRAELAEVMGNFIDKFNLK